jgi:hypothetical protein
MRAKTWRARRWIGHRHTSHRRGFINLSVIVKGVKNIYYTPSQGWFKYHLKEMAQRHQMIECFLFETARIRD